MLTPRRAAQFGLSAAVIGLATCLVVIGSNTAADLRFLAAQPGESAPDFVLTSVSTASPVSLQDFRGTPTLLYFCSIRCPVSNAYDSRIADLYSRYGKSGRLNFVAIHSGRAGDSRDEVAVQTAAAGLTFTHLLDPDASVATRYGATQTPTFLLLDGFGQTCYRGPLDDNQNREQVTKNYLQQAITAVLADRRVEVPTAEVKGCAIR